MLLCSFSEVTKSVSSLFQTLLSCCTEREGGTATTDMKLLKLRAGEDTMKQASEALQDRGQVVERLTNRVMLLSCFGSKVIGT